MKMKLPEPRYSVIDDNHKYTILMPNGEKIGPLKSVTTVLNVIDKPALKGWAAKMAAQHFKTEILRLGAKALNSVELERIVKEATSAHAVFAKDAADLGSACHDAFEAIILGNELEKYPDALKEPITAFKNWRLGAGSDIEIDTETAGSLEHRFFGRLAPSAIGARGGTSTTRPVRAYGNEYAYQVWRRLHLALEEQFGIDGRQEIIRSARSRPTTEGWPVAASRTPRTVSNALVPPNELKRSAALPSSARGSPRREEAETKAQAARSDSSTKKGENNGHRTPEAPTEVPKYTLPKPRKA